MLDSPRREWAGEGAAVLGGCRGGCRGGARRCQGSAEPQLPRVSKREAAAAQGRAERLPPFLSSLFSWVELRGCSL